ncbi:class F sortase, partial [Streptomyces sp. NPDC054863]
MGQEWRGAHPKRRAPWGALALAMLTGLALLRNGSDVTFGPPQPAAAAARDNGSDGSSAPRRAGVAALPYAPAARVRIPAVKVDAPVVDVGLDQEGWIEAPPPQDANLAGWYQNGIAPGQNGT